MPELVISPGKSRAKRTKTWLLKARLSAEQRALFERAAALSGHSLTDFVIGSLQTAAEDAIRTHEVLTLSARDSLALAESILNPPPPNEHLIALDREYREFVER